MAVLEKAYEAVRGRGARVVFPEIDEPRVAEACARLRRQGLAEPVGLGPVSEAQIAALAANRGMKEGIARRRLTRPLIRAAAMVGSRVSSRIDRYAPIGAFYAVCSCGSWEAETPSTIVRLIIGWVWSVGPKSLSG